MTEDPNRKGVFFIQHSSGSTVSLGETTLHEACKKSLEKSGDDAGLKLIEQGKGEVNYAEYWVSRRVSEII